MLYIIGTQTSYTVQCVNCSYCLDKNNVESLIWLADDYCKAQLVHLQSTEVKVEGAEGKIGVPVTWHIFVTIIRQLILTLVPTRTTRTPAFWGYPPPPHDYPHYWIPSQKNNRSRTENVTEQTRFSKSRSNDLEDIGQGQRSSHATHLLMLVIICTKYGKNPSRTVDATERTRFSRSTPNDLEDIGQGQRSSHATHLLMLVIICTKYGKNPSRTVDATERTRFSRSRPNDLEDIGQGQRSSCATHLLMLVIICTIYGKNPSRTVDATERTQFSRSRPNDLEDIGQGQRSLYATHPLMLVIICAKYGKNPSRIVDFFFQGQGQKVLKICQNFKFPDSEKNVTRDTPSNDSDHLCQI